MVATMPLTLPDDALRAESVALRGDGGDEIEAYLARPARAGSRGGVVVIHHMPGYDRATKELTRRFAESGYDAICVNLFSREAPGAAPDDAAAAARAAGGVPDARLVGDVAAAAAYLRALPDSNGKVGTIGFCSGGRQSVLAACSTDIDAAVDCYGAFVLDSPPENLGSRATSLADLLPDLRCPLLGLFGAEDSHPSPEEVERLSAILDRHGKAHEFHTFPDAGHGFFAVDRPSYRPAAAGDGWQRIVAWFDTYLGS
jgi:carboxymethylenebutenolidase